MHYKSLEFWPFLLKWVDPEEQLLAGTTWRNVEIQDLDLMLWMWVWGQGFESRLPVATHFLLLLPPEVL